MPLAEQDLIALLRKEEEAASGYQDAALSAIREEARSPTTIASRMATSRRAPPRS
jgi:hypothetical protein